MVRRGRWFLSVDSAPSEGEGRSASSFSPGRRFGGAGCDRGSVPVPWEVPGQAIDPAVSTTASVCSWRLPVGARRNRCSFEVAGGSLFPALLFQRPRGGRSVDFGAGPLPLF